MLLTEDFDLSRAAHAAAGLALSDGRDRRSGPIRSEANARLLGLATLYAFRHSARTRLSTEAETPGYWVALPAAGGPIRRIASPSRADPFDMRSSETMLGVWIDESTMTRQAEQWFGEPLSTPVRFCACADCPTTADAIVAVLMKGTIRDADAPGVTLSSGLAVRLSEAVLRALLIHRRHSHEGWMRRSLASPSPRDMTRAIDYLEAHAAARPSLADLAAVAGVPTRTLSTHFVRFAGLSPARYGRRVRLQQARASLRDGTAMSVAEAAAAAGFAHLGRFAAQYAAAFGEAPRETLRRTRVAFS